MIDFQTGVFRINILTSKLTPRAGLLVVLALGGLLRIQGLDRDLWHDEAVALFNARGANFVPSVIPNGPEFTNAVFTHDGGIGGMLTAIGYTEDSPPLYFLLLRLWIKTLGESNRTLRLLSVILGLGTIAALYILGCALLSQWTGLVAAAYLALAPIHIQFSQEVRAYSLVLLLVTLASWAYWRACQTAGEPTSRKYWVVYGGLGAVSLYTHYFAAGVFIAHGLYALVQPRALRLAILKRVIPVGLIVLLLFMPWLTSSYLDTQINTPGFGWTARPLWEWQGLEFLANSLCYLVAGWRAEVTYKSVVGIFPLVAIVMSCLNLRYGLRESRPAFRFSLLLFLVPILMVIGAAVALGRSNPLMPPKYVLPSLIGLLLVVSSAILTRQRPFTSAFIGIGWIVLSLGFEVVLFGNPSRVAHPYWHRNYGDISSAVRKVTDQAKPKELIVFPTYVAPVWNVYSNAPHPQIVLSNDRFYFNHPRDFDQCWQRLEGKYDGLFLVNQLRQSPGEILLRIARNYREDSRLRTDTLEIRHFVKVSP